MSILRKVLWALSVAIVPVALMLTPAASFTPLSIVDNEQPVLQPEISVSPARSAVKNKDGVRELVVIPRPVRELVVIPRPVGELVVISRPVGELVVIPPARVGLAGEEEPRDQNPAAEGHEYHYKKNDDGTYTQQKVKEGKRGLPAEGKFVDRFCSAIRGEDEQGNLTPTGYAKDLIKRHTTDGVADVDAIAKELASHADFDDETMLHVAKLLYSEGANGQYSRAFIEACKKYMNLDHVAAVEKEFNKWVGDLEVEETIPAPGPWESLF